LRSNTNFKPLSSKAKKSFTPSKSGVIVSLSVDALGLFPPAPLIRKFTYSAFNNHFPFGLQLGLISFAFNPSNSNS
jgi:hypothetical protein